MYATNYFETQVLNAMRGTTFSAPSTVYIGLFLSNPGETGSTTSEISYAGYARQAIQFSVPALDGTSMRIQNSAQVTFPESPTDAGTVTYVGIMDSLTGGNMLVYGQLTDELVVYSGYAPVLLTGEVEYYLSGDMTQAMKTNVLNCLRGINLTGFDSYFALFNGSPESGGSELSGDNYARVALPFSAPAQAESGQAYIQNSSAVNFNRPSDSWGQYSYSAIMNAASGGQPVWIKQVSPSREIKKGYMPIIGAGNVRLSIN